MIISCPDCKTRYVVAPRAIGKKGRLVKCSKCAHTWFQDPAEKDHEIIPEKVIIENVKDERQTNQGQKNKPLPEGEIKRNVPAVVKQKSPNIAVGWGLLVVFLLGISGSLYYFRPTLEVKYELAATLYEKWDYVVLGKQPASPPAPPPIVEVSPHPATYLAMRQSAEVRFTDGAPGLFVALEVTNDADFDIELPAIYGVIRNIDGEELFSWTQKLTPSVVPANGFQQYQLIVENIPPTSAEAEISLYWEGAF